MVMALESNSLNSILGSMIPTCWSEHVLSNVPLSFSSSEKTEKSNVI